MTQNSNSEANESGEDSSVGTARTRVPLTGVPETLLWPLYNRAAEARRPHTFLRDPKAIALMDSIDYPFREHFGRPSESHVLRALRFDEQIRSFLARHPEATVVGLAEGLETQFWRVDNGRMKWLAVDLPQTIQVRQRFLPDAERHRNLACSALDFRWMDQVDASKGVFITAAGLLMYLQPEEVQRLLVACAKRFAGGEMIFDTVPRWFSSKTMRGFYLTKAYRTPPMPWGLNADELQSIHAWSSNIAEVQEIYMGHGRGFLFRHLVRVLQRVPVVKYKRPSFVLVRFRETI